MKNLKVKLSALALMLGVSSAFAGMHHRAFSDRKWTQDPSTGIYTEITGQVKGVDYSCNASSNNCSETYPQTVEPNTNPAPGQPGHVDPLSTELGDFQ